MKLRLSLLKKFISLPSNDPQELRFLLDDDGLEVKDVEPIQDDYIFNIETLANRGDHLYALGVARELSGRLLTQVNLPTVAATLSEKPISLKVRNETDKCLRYSLLEMTLPEKLDLRPEVAAMFPGGSGNDPIVDYLNYVQMELGQPMHVFDYDKIDGEMVVELTSKEEEVVALSGKTLKVPPGSIIIRDRKQIIDVAGITGMANTMVSSKTRRILVEAATFDPVCVRKTAKKMGISTDASYAFERGVDPENILFALRRLAYLTQGSGGAVSSSGAQVMGFTFLKGQPLPERKISLSLNKLKEQICSPRLNEVEVISRLKALGFGVSQQEKELVVVVPSWRIWDVFNDDDIIEEFCKSHGYNNIKLELPPLDYEFQGSNDHEKLLEKIEPVLLGSGFLEVISSSFSSDDDVRVLNELHPGSDLRHVKVANSVEGKYACMKLNNIIQLAKLAMHNSQRGVHSFKAYEVSRFYRNAETGETSDTGAIETDTISLAQAGRWYDNDWRKPESTEDLLTLFRGTVLDIFRAARCKFELVASKNPFLHPGQQAGIKLGRQVVATFGTIHPRVNAYLDFKPTILYAEIDEQALIKGQAEYSLTQPSDLPVSTRDITLKVNAKTSAGDVLRYIEATKPPNLVRTNIVDSFTKTGEDFRRVSYRLLFQDATRTLESSEVDAAMQTILETLKSQHQIELAN